MKAFKPTDSWGPNDIELSTKVKYFPVLITLNKKIVILFFLAFLVKKYKEFIKLQHYAKESRN